MGVQRQAAATQLAQRRELLELEAEVQRAALSATFAELEEKRALKWVTGAGMAAVRALAAPRVRWLILSTLLAKLRKRKHGSAH